MLLFQCPQYNFNAKKVLLIQIRLNSDLENLIELFEMHDQIFLLKNDEVYKLHISKENVHKLFLN